MMTLAGFRRGAVRLLVLLAIIAPFAASAQSAAADVVRAIEAERSHIHDLVTAAALNAGVPVAVAHALVKRESGYRVRAVGAAGEIGLVQIKLATARGLGFKGTREQLFEPRINLAYGMRYARMALDRGSIRLYQTGF